MNKTSLALLFVVSLILTGCATPPPRVAATESGNPEVVIESVTVEAVHDRLIERLISKGARLDIDTPSRITVSKEVEGQREMWLRLAISNSYSTTVRADLNFSIIKIPAGVKVFAQMSAWSQMPGGQIQRMDLNGNQDFNDVQESLYRLRDSFKPVQQPN